jgi:hypothetical protein
MYPITCSSRRRRRRPVLKSFTGCERCKSRKVRFPVPLVPIPAPLTFCVLQIKCDETKPNCLNCKQKDFVCPGFDERRFRWSTKHEISQSDNPYDRRTPQIATSHLMQRDKQGSHQIADKQHRPPLCSAYSDSGNTDTSSEMALLDWAFCEADSPPEAPWKSNRDHSFTRSDRSLASVELPSPAPSSVSILPSSGGSNAENITEYDENQTAVLFPPGDALTSSIRQLSHAPSELVCYYFDTVCSLASTYDSDLNPFRRFISGAWQNSMILFSAIQGLSAAHIANKATPMRRLGLCYQNAFLKQLQLDILQNGSLSIESLFAIFLLGPTACWYDAKDSGIAHLKVAQHTILSPNFEDSADGGTTRFFKHALIYWEMVVSVMDDSIDIHDLIDLGLSEDHRSLSDPIGPLKSKYRVQPHPWTGVAAEQLILLSRVTRLIRRLLPFQRRMPICQATLSQLFQFMEQAEALEAEVWNLQLPTLDQIDSVGDPKSLSIQYLLLAETYIVASLYQLYFVFPDMLQTRRELMMKQSLTNGDDNQLWTVSVLGHQSSLFQKDVSSEECLRQMGRNIVVHLQQVPFEAASSCQKILLFLISAGALHTPDKTPPSEGQGKEVLQAREFISAQLDYLRLRLGSQPVDSVKSVIQDMFAALDRGKEVFWMDYTHHMGVCPT